MITLKKQVLMLHDRLIEVTGGSKGICDEGTHIMLVFLAIISHQK